MGSWSQSFWIIDDLQNHSPKEKWMKQAPRIRKPSLSTDSTQAPCRNVLVADLCLAVMWFSLQPEVAVSMANFLDWMYRSPSSFCNNWIPIHACLHLQLSFIDFWESGFSALVGESYSRKFFFSQILHSPFAVYQVYSFYSSLIAEINWKQQMPFIPAVLIIAATDCICL